MVKKFTILLLGLMAFIGGLNAQVAITMSDETVNPGQTVDVDVTLDNFTDIISFQFTVDYDPTVITFNSIVNVTTELEQFSNSAANFGTPGGTIPEGEINVSWSKTNTQPESLPANTRLFTIRFNTVGSACDDSNLTFSNVEFADDNANTVATNENAGSVLINGTNCGGNGGTLTITADDVTVDSGTNVCVPLTVANFTDIQAVSMTVSYNQGVATYTGINNPNLPGLTNDNVFDNNGEINMFWFDDTGVTPVTYEGILFEMCFDVTGGGGESTDLVFSNTDFANSSDESVPHTAIDGSITATGGTGGSTDFTLDAGDVTIGMGGTGCVPISVRNFNDIQSMQFAIMWDASVLTFTEVSNLNLSDLTASNFNLRTDNKLRVTWNDRVGGTTVPNDQVIFNLCFEAVGDCEASSSIMFTNDPPISIEVSNGDNEVVDVNRVSGSVTVECGCTIGVNSINNPTCNNGTNGSILVNVGGNVTCTWRDANNNIVGQAGECNLTNVGAGVYTITISDGQGCNESRSFTLTAPNAIVFGGSKLDENEGCDGSIALQMVGGTAPFTFSWGDGSTSSQRSNLCAGEYCVTATDVNGCIASSCFTINPSGPGVVSETITNVTCFGGSNGAINITVAGGTSPYTFNWSGPSGTFTTEDISNVRAGTYNLTITDSSNPQIMTTFSYAITQPSEIIISGNVTHSDGNNGAIDINVSGGSGTYSYLWADGTNSQDRTGLAPGTYTVTITDGTCSVSESIDVFNRNLSLSNISGNISVTCNGDCDGTIDGEIIGGSGNFTYLLDGNQVSFPVTDLCPGEYEFRVEDAIGVFDSKSITITEPTVIEVSVFNQSSCPFPNGEGTISLQVEGGAAPYDFQWSVPSDNEATISNLDYGTYSVLITDANGCSVALEDIDLDCGGTGEIPCFTSRTVITPNGDGMNDEFYIECATNFSNTLKVFNRWGQLVFEASDYDNTWLGVDSAGNELPEGGYMWILETTDSDNTKSINKGTVTILRDRF